MLLVRIALSVVSFCAFVVLAVSWVLTHEPILQYTLLIPLVLAVFILPRRLPTHWEDPPPAPDELDGLNRVRLWLSYVRVAYFVVAVFVMLVLPEILF